LLVVAALTVGVLTVVTAATADPSIESKRAQARAVLDQIRELDSDLSQAIERYNYASIRLQELDGELTSNARHLVIAKSSLRAGQTHIAQRLKTLYINGGGGGVVEVMLGATSLDDMLTRIDVADAVGRKDAKILADVRRFTSEVKARKKRLQKARAWQAEVVTERAATKRWIEGRLAERQRLLSSIQDEIARLEAEERRRQARLAAQAAARLAAEQRAAEQARQLAATAAQAVSATSGVSPLSTSSEPEWLDPLSVASPAPPPSPYGGVVGIAMQYLGTPYVWGGMSPAGFDCSGLIAYAYAQVGVSLPHHAASQFNQGVPVGRGELQPGDLVFFDGLGHAGIYIGGDQFVHSPHTGDVVKISSLNDSWYAATWVGARRIT
jgi:cell wall-associated NlpC family hydrolase